MLSQAPKRLQKILMKIQEYDFNLVYKKSCEIYLINALPRAPPPPPEPLTTV